MYKKTPRKLFSGLTAKLILAVLLVSLIPLSLLAFLNNRNTQTILIENANQSLSAAASQIAANLDIFFKINLDNLKVEAQLPTLITYLSLPPDQRAGSLAEEAALATLQGLRRKNRIFITSYALLDYEGQNVLDTNPDGIGQDESHEEYFQRPIESGLPEVSHITLANPHNPHWEDMIIHFSNPIRDTNRGETIGVLRIRYKAAALQQLVVANNGFAGEKSYAILFDENLIYLAHGTAPNLIFKTVQPLDSDRIAHLQALDRLPDLLPDNLSTNSSDLADKLANATFEPIFTAKLPSTDDTSTSDGLNLIVVKELKTHPWLVIFVQPETVFLAPINAQTRNTIYLAIAIGCAVVAVAFMAGRTLAAPLLELTEAVSRFTAGDLEVRANIKSNDERETLAASFNTMAEQVGSLLKNLEERTHELEAEIIERERAESQLVQLSVIERELVIAQQIQQNLLPPTKPNWPDLDVICFSNPAREVGGDLYSYHEFPFAQEFYAYAFAIGDVSGKGVSAALLMAIGLSQFDASLTLGLSPAERMIYLDEAILPYTKLQHQNCAMCYVELRMKNEESPVAENQFKILKREASPTGDSKFLIDVVNAGCIPPYIKRADGSVEFDEEMGGFALGQGLGSMHGYQEHTIELFSGDMVILTSDGVVEANNEAGDMLGFERLEQIVREFEPDTSFASQDLQGFKNLEGLNLNGAEAMLEHLKREVFAFTKGAEQHDDMTMVVIRV
ncbi:SpoIIE family protein phosphatase [Anaerolineales bacterium HSG24]|nr:SpoIIE family protein phosphatase [Anaerolineales bacterium HSG24]